MKTEGDFDEDNCQERTTVPRGLICNLYSINNIVLGTVNSNTSSMKQFHALDSLTYEFTKTNRPSNLLSSGSSNKESSYYETEHTYCNLNF